MQRCFYGAVAVALVAFAPEAYSTPKPPEAASWDNSSFANEDSRGGETFSGNSGGSGTVYTGPRGGQYQINSHGNKSYLSSRGGSRGGRR